MSKFQKKVLKLMRKWHLTQLVCYDHTCTPSLKMLFILTTDMCIIHTYHDEDHVEMQEVYL